MLPANARLDWKVIAKYKRSSLFGLIVSNEGKKFYNIDTRWQCCAMFSSSMTADQNKLECLPHAVKNKLECLPYAGQNKLECLPHAGQNKLECFPHLV